MSVSEGILWIPRLLAVFLLAYFLTVQIDMIQDIREEPRHLELALYRQRLINGPQGIVLRDSDGRAIAGYIDETKLKDDYLMNIYVQEVPVFAAKLQLYDRAEQIGTDTARITAKHYTSLLDSTLEIAKAGVRGKGSASYEHRVYPFLSKTDTGVQPVWLEVEVIRLT